MGLLNMFKKKITVVTHSGTFHADDVFAIAILKIWADKNSLKLKIIRSRDPEIIKRADIAIDVGDRYEPEKGRFDHHQVKNTPKRDNGIPYAAIGLVWKHYGDKICSKEEAERIEKRLVMPIDARDNGIAVSAPNGLGIIDHRTSNMICDFNPTWLEPKDNTPKQFEKALGFAVEILKREMIWAKAEIEGSKLTRKVIEEQDYPEILVLSQYTEYEEEVSKHEKIKFVISPGSKEWVVQATREDLEDYDSDRAKLPRNWWGLRDATLEKESGIKDVIVCLYGGWMGRTKTKEAAIEMARKALETS